MKSLIEVGMILACNDGPTIKRMPNLKNKPFEIYYIGKSVLQCSLLLSKQMFELSMADLQHCYVPANPTPP
jgi:hypothetical protein